MSTSRAGRTPAPTKSRTVSRPHDPAEVQADKAADVVARGGSVSGWSFGSVPVEAGVHREDKGKPSDEDKLKEAAKKTGEAVLETEAGKKLQEKVKETPLVKEATKFLDTTAGKVVAGTAIAGVAGGVVGGSAAAKKPLPFQAPAIPLDKITPGLSANVTLDGPVNAPTFVGLSLTYKEQGPKSKGPTDGQKIAADVARLKAQQEMFKPQAQKDQEKADNDAAIAYVVANNRKLFGSSTLLPLSPGDKPKTVEVPKEQPAEQKKDKDETPVQREPATGTVSESAADTSGVEDAVRGGGRPLDSSTRRSMEARFGYDFSGVRIHDDAGASSAAARADANAFTVGEDIVFGSGGYDPSTPQGRHLLAHELAHVVQQRGQGPGASAEHLHRRSIFESIGIWLGLVEGTWSDVELRAYLDALTKNGKIDGSYDADNKARAIVRLWKQGAAGWDLSGAQKALLIDEMIDGPTLGDDEECILDLLERSDAGDLREIFRDSQTRTLSLEDNIQGENRIRLNTFEASRFSGGRTELLAGRVVVLGDPVPAKSPSFAFSAATFDGWLDSDRSPEEMIALFDRFDATDQTSATNHLMRTYFPKQEAAESVADAEYDDAEDSGSKTQEEAARKKSELIGARRQKAERILAHYFSGRAPSAVSELDSTRAQDPARAAELTAALVRPPEKAGATFDVKKDGAAYRAAVEKAVVGDVNHAYRRRVTEQGARVASSEVDPIAELAKNEVDAVFGRYYDVTAHPPLVFDKAAVPATKGHPAVPAKPGTLHSWFDAAEVDRKQVGDLEIAKGWLRYYFSAHGRFRRINAKFAAAPKFDGEGRAKNDEAGILLEIIDAETRKPEIVRKLVEALSNWGAMSRGREVFVDLFRKTDPTQDRLARWEMLQALIHEYVHTLRHQDYDAYADTLGVRTAANNTLIEGMDDLLDTLVWDRLVPKLRTPEIRKVVEPKYASLPAVAVPPAHHYPSYGEALRLVDLVGIENVCAAYFRGLVDRISSSPDAVKLAKDATKVNAAADAKKKKGIKP